MKVYLDDDGDQRLVGIADIPDDTGPVFELSLFGAASTIVDRFTIGTVTRMPEGDGAPVVERVVLLSLGQRPELLPGWKVLAS